MADPSPQAARLRSPGWLDKRLVVGVALVLISVLLGARTLSGAQDTQLVWSASHDLAAGTVLAEGDLTLAKARLFGTSGRYLAGSKPVGYVVQRSVSAAELVPVDALAAPGKTALRREVTVPVLAGHLPPDLRRGEQVDLYVTPDDKAVQRGVAAGPRLVLAALTVAEVVRSGGLGASGQDQPVVLAVAPGQVLGVVQALSEGRLDLVRVPRAEQSALVPAT
ncbi:MAG: hypothetical protein JWM40_205 [Frankiales bacterium]|nr:hypothetical protein [Frankiales bacterium]